MKILIFSEISHAGGLDTFLVTLVRHWPDKNDEIKFLCNASHPGLPRIRERLYGKAQVESHGIQIYMDLVLRAQNSCLLNFLRRIGSPALRAFCAVNTIFKLQKLFRSENADRLLVVAGGYPGGDSCRLATIAWKAATSGKPRAILNVHNLATVPSRFNPVEYLIDRAVARSISRVIAVSHACAISMKNRPLIWNNRTVEFILNGIAPAPAKIDPEIRHQLRLRPHEQIVLMLATYEPRKGHAFLFKAFKQVIDRIPAARLVICGYGYPVEIEAVRAELRANLLENVVQLLGFRSDTAELLGIADVLVVPSQSFESFGLTCVEAMAAGVPVVATNVGGLAEVVLNADGGYTTAPDDIDAFAGHIIRLLANPELRAEQSALGKKRQARLFSAARMADEYAARIHQTEAA